MELNVLTLRHFRTFLGMAVRKLWRLSTGHRNVEAHVDTPGEFIDVRSLIRDRSIEELNESADDYFRQLGNWNHHLAKPFASPDDAPSLLINFATMLQGLRLAPGIRVLDFGAGTGWTAHYLTQLGCEVVLVDVSKTALEIAAELYRRQPVIGDQPSPRFLPFNGRRIDLPDASVDRILSFDAFHHTTNPDEILFEFARILAPGGIAAFAEPGPAHSRTPQSQSEMRTYGVIENDIDIHAIWHTAREAGFSDIRLAAYNVPPYHVSLEKYDDLLRGGATYLRWAESTRAFLGDVRNFFLVRAGSEPLDSRRTEGLAADIVVDVPDRVAAGEPFSVRAVVTNRGQAIWRPAGSGPGGVFLGCHLYDSRGQIIAYDHHRQPLAVPARPIQASESVELTFDLPPLAEGEFVLEFDCVSDRVTWFAQQGSAAVRVAVRAVAQK